MADDTTPGPDADEGPNVATIDINEEMAKSFVDYAMSVIVSRALPDVRDGLKPVQRRIIYAMDDMGVRPGGAHRKSATVVGEVIGKYHPHSNDAIYDALVRMGQDFSLRYPLIDPQGNFGTIEDPRRPCDIRNVGWIDWRQCCWTASMSGPWILKTTTTVPNNSRRFSQRVFPTCWSMVRRELPLVWPPTCRPTTLVRSLRHVCSAWRIQMPGQRNI